MTEERFSEILESVKAFNGLSSPQYLWDVVSEMENYPDDYDVPKVAVDKCKEFLKVTSLSIEELCDFSFAAFQKAEDAGVYNWEDF